MFCVHAGGEGKVGCNSHFFAKYHIQQLRFCKNEETERDMLGIVGKLEEFSID